MICMSFLGFIANNEKFVVPSFTVGHGGWLLLRLPIWRLAHEMQ